jgi:hypothetical protein
MSSTPIILGTLVHDKPSLRAVSTSDAPIIIPNTTYLSCETPGCVMTAPAGNTCMWDCETQARSPILSENSESIPIVMPSNTSATHIDPDRGVFEDIWQAVTAFLAKGRGSGGAEDLSGAESLNELDQAD